MSGDKLTQAHKDWWLIPVSPDHDGNLLAGPAAEIIAWHIEPVLSDLRGVEDFISTPVTIYGTIDFEFGVVRSANGKFYSSEVEGVYDTLAQIITALEPVSRLRLYARQTVERKASKNAN